MRYHHILTLLFSLLTVLPLQAQHSISVVPDDTVCLKIDAWRGDLQWQLSYDQTSWNDLKGETNDSLKYVPLKFPSYFRAKITEGTCHPYYSDTIEVKLVTGLPTVTTTVNISGAGTMSGISGGNVTSAGSSVVTARGVVYSTSPDPSLKKDLFTSNSSGTGSYIAIISGLTPNTLYYVRAYATNSKGTSYGEILSFRTQSSVIYSIGDVGPAGGIIFYDKGSYSDGWRYLEAAPKGWAGEEDPWVDVDWGCNEILIGQTSTDVGTGKENTDRILANGCAVENTAAKIAAEADINGYTDWFLPSRDELNNLYQKLFNLGPNFSSTYGFASFTYASSSENNETSVWGVGFGGGTNINHSKVGVTIAVRPVRRF